MEGKSVKSVFSIVLIALLLVGVRECESLPLSTSGRWIVDSNGGERVKLACVNWASHMQTMVAEGLDKQPLKDIAGSIGRMGFNCVRLTWATYMFTRPSYGTLTVAKSFQKLGLNESLGGLAVHNPNLLSLTVRQAYEVVVDQLGSNGLMVVLDNHVSKPQWCCSLNDGNGFFGDVYFDANEWLQGLAIVAFRFKHKPQVVGMSIRNELRGPNQTEHVWYSQMRNGAMVVHMINPKVLVIVSGLSYDNDLSFLKKKPFLVNIPNKLVLEGHWYAFSTDKHGQEWNEQPLNAYCRNRTDWFESAAAFVATGTYPTPFFLTEFGVDMRGATESDNRYFTCFLTFAAQRDLDWAIWTLPGGYYYKNGVVGPEEPYGVLNYNFDGPRNHKFLQRMRILQRTLQVPNSNVAEYHLLFHPRSGRCVTVEGDEQVKKITGRNCEIGSRWRHEGDGGAIRLVGSQMCLKAAGDGLPVMLSSDCDSPQARWKLISPSKLHIATVGDDQTGGGSLCLDGKRSRYSTILTTKCLGDSDSHSHSIASNSSHNPHRQWFKLVPSNLP